MGQSSSLTVLSPCLLIGPDPSAQGGKVTLSWLRKIKQTRQRDGLSYKWSYKSETCHICLVAINVHQSSAKLVDSGIVIVFH